MTDPGSPRRSHWTTTIPIVAVLGGLATGAFKAGELSSEQSALRQGQAELRDAVNKSGAAIERLATASETRLRQLEDYRLKHEAESARLIPIVERLQQGASGPRK